MAKLPEPRAALTETEKAWLKEMGRQLREAREAAGLTKVAAARAIGKCPATLRRIEQGTTICTELDVVRLLDRYGVPWGKPWRQSQRAIGGSLKARAQLLPAS
jgi:transcriptional regulator with XRE-family HTH domain